MFKEVSNFAYSTLRNLISIAFLVAAFMVLALFCREAFSQFGQPLGDVRSESRQGVDPYTGRTYLNVPIAQIKGRGEVGASLGVSIPQPQWQIVETMRVYDGQGRVVQVSYAATQAPSVYPQNVVPYLTPATLRIVTRGTTDLGWGFNFLNAISNVIEFTTSDGQKIELRDIARDGEFSVLGSTMNPPANNNCFVQTYDNQTPFPQPLPPGQVAPPSHPTCDRGRVFRAVDGSGITFVADEDIYDAMYSENRIAGMGWETVFSGGFFGRAKGVLHFPNGARYRFETGAIQPSNGHDSFNHDNGTLVWMEDRNGNRTSFQYNNDPGCYSTSGGGPYSCFKLTKIIDSINREINLSYGDATQDAYFDTVTYKGFDQNGQQAGAERQIRINHDRLRNTLRPDQVLRTPHELFPSVGTVTVNNPSLTSDLDRYKKDPGAGNLTTDFFDPKVIASIVLPDGENYTFQYNSYGELARTRSPLGSYVDIDYGAINDSGADVYGVLFVHQPELNSPRPDKVYRRGTEVLTYDSSGDLQTKSTYSGAGGISPVTIKQLDGDGTTVLSASKHYFFIGNDVPSLIPSELNLISHTSWKEHREYRTEILDPDDLSSVLGKTENTWEQRAPVTWWGSDWYDGFEPQNDPRVIEAKTTLETGQVTKRTFNYDQFNNVTDTFDYDYGNGQPGPFLRRSHTDYVTDSNYTSHTGAHLKGLPLQNWVSSDTAGNNRASLTQYEYDNYGVLNPLFPRSSVSGHNSSGYGTANALRGNTTKVTGYSNAQSQTGAVSTVTQYDILGNVVKTIDPNGNFVTFDYTDRFGSPNAEARANTPPSQLNGLNAFAFVTEVTKVTNSVNFISYAQHDYFTGLVVDEEDPNGNVNSSFYNDILDRATQKILANNRPDLRSQTTTSYDDTNRKVTVTSDLFSFGDNLSKTESFYDSLGRTTETRSYESGGYVVTSKPQYDSLNRVVQSTNPYRPYLNEQPVWTTTIFDDLSRVVKVRTPDNLETTSSYSGNNTTVTDQAGKKRRSVTNALGQLIRVDEPDGANNLGEVSVPTQPTYYSYSAAGNLVKVSQGQQNRYFLYDSLGRLIRVRQPEQNTNSSLTLNDPVTGNNQWSTGTTYDPNGNALTTTDAKGIVITHTYDSLNRPLTRIFSDGTPSVTYQYDDATVPFGKGQLTKVSSSVSTAEYTAFDAAGRILGHRQITDGQIYPTAYSYNLFGGLVEETYPSGRVVRNAFDSYGKLKDVVGKPNGQSDFHLYASNFSYTPDGSVSSMRLGNGRWESLQFNSRLQITQIGLGSSQGAANLWKAKYDYGEIDAVGNLDTSKNNGNIARQTIEFTGLDQAYVQTYKYDPLSRLIEAREFSGTTQTWVQNFGYDRYGNRNGFNQQTIGVPDITQTPTVDPTTNRFTTGQGFVYDLNGNLIADNQGRHFTFDGDNKQVEVTDSANNVVGLYYFDGSGNRVKKISVSETTVFVYDAIGRLVAEYSTQTVSNPTISYLTSDILGSPRVITDNGGIVVSRRDFMPFGEELYANTANRTTTGKYSPYGVDNVRKRFTGYEKDTETGLDFAEARMYDNRYGRFTAVDPLLASGLSGNPQSLNRYAYVSNEPVRNTDSTGMWSDHEWSSLNPGFFSPEVRDLWSKAEKVWNDPDLFRMFQRPNVIRDDYYVARNGSIDVYLTDDNFDRFFVETKDTPGKFSLVATLTKNSSGLVEFPSSGSGFGRYGTVDAGGGDHGSGDHYVKPIVAAALFGLVAVLRDDYGLTISFGDMSSSNGRDPWEPGFKHHGGHGHNGRSGLDVDYRYLDKNGQSFQSPTATTDPQFDIQNNQAVNDVGRRFGFTTNYQGTNGQLRGVTKVAGHNDHGHLGFNMGSNVRIHRVIRVLPNGTRVYN